MPVDDMSIALPLVNGPLTRGQSSTAIASAGETDTIEPARVSSSIAGAWAVPVLGGRGRVEQGAAPTSPRTTWPRAGTAGKPATRFLAASSVTVIRVDPTRPPAHQCAWHLSSTRIRTRRGIERSEGMSGDRFPALRKRAADGQCRCGDPATAPPHLTPAGRSGEWTGRFLEEFEAAVT